ncbi:macrophage receptor MARCO-like [Pecten maximus]|uniref:macrophage receptor MARCO-like n=1 Tax=Pecten maximus TaxID=6579 RepID=UPI001458DE09|nr:macrophage receptor MARCO-like [Pecten maximus]
MAAGALMISFLSLVLSDATPIDTQLQNLQHQVKSLNNVLNDVIKEFVDLRQKHEDLENKFHDVSAELKHVRKEQDRMGRRMNRNLGGLSEERSAFSQRSGTGNPGLKGEKGDTGLAGPKGEAGIAGPKGDTGIAGPKGDAGLAGPKGDAGIAGPKGDAGLAGLKGDAGTPGPQGTSGSKGQKGHAGLKGEPGVNVVQHQIAFHAELGDDMVQILDDQHINMQDDIFTIGGGYDRNTGVFVSPVDGVYLFSVTVLVNRHGHVEVELKRNGDTILDLYAEAVDENESGSNMVLVHLHANDKVWVQVHDRYYDPSSMIDNHFTTFTGFLLYA